MGVWSGPSPGNSPCDHPDRRRGIRPESNATELFAQWYWQDLHRDAGIQEARCPAAETRGPKVVTAFAYIDARPTNAIALARALFQCAQSQAAVLLLDDPGPIAHNEDGLDVLKTGFGAQRTVMLETRQNHVQRALPPERTRRLQPIDPAPEVRHRRSALLVALRNPMSQRISLRNRRTSRSPNRPPRRSSPN